MRWPAIRDLPLRISGVEMIRGAIETIVISVVFYKIRKIGGLGGGGWMINLVFYNTNPFCCSSSSFFDRSLLNPVLGNSYHSAT